MRLDELPHASCVAVVETATLRVVADMVRAGGLELVLMLSEDDGQALGVIDGGAVLRLSDRIPEAPVRLLPSSRTVEVKACAPMVEVRRALMAAPLDAAVVTSLGNGWRVYPRERLVSRG